MSNVVMGDPKCYGDSNRVFCSVKRTLLSGADEWSILLVVLNSSSMKKETYLKATGIIFLVVALLHLARLVKGWDMVFGGWMAPTWLSVVAILVSGYLSYTALSCNVK